MVLPALRRPPACRWRDRLFDRSWYNRAGVERVMVSVRKKKSKSSSLSPGVRADAGPSRPHADQVLVFITDEEQHLRFLGRIADPLKQWS